jgi:hypothetical protein
LDHCARSARSSSVTGWHPDVGHVGGGHAPQPLSHSAIFLGVLMMTRRVRQVSVAAIAVLGSQLV